jgi:hypothetical protein
MSNPSDLFTGLNNASGNASSKRSFQSNKAPFSFLTEKGISYTHAGVNIIYRISIVQFNHSHVPLPRRISFLITKMASKISIITVMPLLRLKLLNMFGKNLFTFPILVSKHVTQANCKCMICTTFFQHK